MMNPINDGGPAFPGQQSLSPDGTWNQTFDPGMTLLDWFAGMALQGLLVSSGANPKDAASEAYLFAEEMVLWKQQPKQTPADRPPPRPPLPPETGNTKTPPPKGARFWAMDEDREAYWYSLRPCWGTKYMGLWDTSGLDYIVQPDGFYTETEVPVPAEQTLVELP